MTLICGHARASRRLAGAGCLLLNAPDISNRPIVDQISPNPSDAVPELWGLTIAQFSEILVPLNVAAGFAFTLVFAVVAVFAKRWKLGFAVLGVGMLLVAAPWIVTGLRMDGTAEQMALQVLTVWWLTFPRFALLFLPLAWLVRWIWDDLGRVFEVILDRWGLRGAVVFIAVVLAGCAGYLALRHPS